MYNTLRVLTFFCEEENASLPASKLKLFNQAEGLIMIVSFPGLLKTQDRSGKKNRTEGFLKL